VSIITYNGLKRLVAAGIISNVPLERVNAASVDVTLGSHLWIEDNRGGIVDLAAKETPRGRLIDIANTPYHLAPGEFVLAQTAEVFNLPANLDEAGVASISAEFRLKSSGARAGLDAASAHFCDPGWHGSVLTLELRNNLQYHSLILTAGSKIGQMIFFAGEPVPAEASYAARGRYNNDRTTTPSKGIR
jgi:dCTP deaminase